MMTQAVKYEMQLQLKFPDEYRLMMQAYADLPHFPKSLQQQIQQETQAISAEANRIFRQKSSNFRAEMVFRLLTFLVWFPPSLPSKRLPPPG